MTTTSHSDIRTGPGTLQRSSANQPLQCSGTVTTETTGCCVHALLTCTSPYAVLADDPDQPMRPRLRAGLSTLQRSSAAAAAAGTSTAVVTSTAFASSPGPITTAASPAQLPPAAARPGSAVQMVQMPPLLGETGTWGGGGGH
jgi:hypothetical protein